MRRSEGSEGPHPRRPKLGREHRRRPLQAPPRWHTVPETRITGRGVPIVHAAMMVAVMPCKRAGRKRCQQSPMDSRTRRERGRTQHYQAEAHGRDV